MDPNRLTPGVINPYAKHCFKYGACGALAIALHDATGWPICAITDSHNVCDGKAGGGSALHWVVRHPSGRFLDIDGLHEADGLVAEYEDDADEQEAALGLSSRPDVVEWYIECQGEPIPVSLAATFIEPLLESLLKPNPTDDFEGWAP